MKDKYLKIWDPNISNDEKNKDQLYVRLVKSKQSNDVILSVCNYKDMEINGGYILVIDQDRKVIIALPKLNNAIPLKTDFYDCILIYNMLDITEKMQSINKSNLEIITNNIINAIHMNEKEGIKSH